MNPSLKKRCIAYARVNILDPEPTIQLHAIRLWAVANGLEIVGTFVDRSSGRTDNRPELRRALQALKDPSVESLVVVSLLKLSRSLAHLCSIVETVTHQRKGLVVLDKKVNLCSSETAGALPTILALARLQREIASERTKVSLKLARQMGAKLGRPTSISDDVREKALAFHASGVPVREIARRLPISRASIQKLISDSKKTKEDPN